MAISREQIDALSPAEVAALAYHWPTWARPEQLPPPGDWDTWLILAGRGFGKTRAGAESVRAHVESGASEPIHLIGATAADVRDTMVEGPAGLLSVFPPHKRPRYEPSKRRVTFHTGITALMFSADEPNRLRGPQCGFMWLDELGAWRRPEAYDMAMMGLRLGKHPRAVITTTPTPSKLLRSLIMEHGTVVTRGSTFDNAPNLAPQFIDLMRRRYEGTRLGRQELNGELLEDFEGSLWKQTQIDKLRVRNAPSLRRIVVAVDPSVTANKDSDECGIVVAGVDAGGSVYVLDDLSAVLSPYQWAQAAFDALREHRADRIVAEVNQGGDLVELNIRQINADVPFRAVRASRGKVTRAEPVAALYEQRRVHHVGVLPGLEAQMTQWIPTAEKSPDRVDALVWAIFDLVLREQADIPASGGGAVDRGLDPMRGRLIDDLGRGRILT